MKYTFGKTPAAQRLEILVKDTPSARRKISRLLSQYSSQLLKITAARDPEIVRLCMELLRDYTLRRIDIFQNMSRDIRTYAKNVVIYRHRVYSRTFDSLLPILEKMRKINNKRRGLTSGNELI